MGRSSQRHLPTIVGDLGGLDHLAWVVTAYLLAETIATPLYGKLGDIYGRKIVLQSAVVIFLIGSALCGFSQGLTALIIFRAIQGLGGGGLSVLSQAVIGDVVSPRERGRYQGIFGAVFGVSSVAGPLLGGYLTTHLFLAVDLFHQRSAGIDFAGGARAHLARHNRSRKRRDRLCRHRVPGDRTELHRALHRPRRIDVWLGIGTDHRSRDTCGRRVICVHFR